MATMPREEEKLTSPPKKVLYFRVVPSGLSRTTKGVQSAEPVISLVGSKAAVCPFTGKSTDCVIPPIKTSPAAFVVMA